MKLFQPVMPNSILRIPVARRSYSTLGFGVLGMLLFAWSGCELTQARQAGSANRFEEVPVVVQDETGQPIEGARVDASGLRFEGDPMTYSVYRPAADVLSDREGRTRVKFRLIDEPAGRNRGRAVLTLRAEHPDYICRNDVDFPTAGTPPAIRLVRGLQLEVSGYFGGDRQPVSDIVPQVSKDGSNVIENDQRQAGWQKKADGAFVFHQLTPGDHFVQLMGRLPSGLNVYSDAIPFRAEPGKVTRLSIEMKPGIRLEGRIDGRVPRPVKNGRVLIQVRPALLPGPLVEGGFGAVAKVYERYGSFNCWQSHRLLTADGAFVFESVPPGEVDVIAMGDGFVSSRPRGESLGRETGVPQPFRLEASPTVIEVATEPSATLEVVARTADGSPVAGAGVVVGPNVLWANTCTTSFGWAETSSERAYREVAALDRPVYQVITDKRGTAKIPNLPAFTPYFKWSHADFELVTKPAASMAKEYDTALEQLLAGRPELRGDDPGTIARRMDAMVASHPEIFSDRQPDERLVALSPGKTTRVEVTVERKKR